MSQHSGQLEKQQVGRQSHLGEELAAAELQLGRVQEQAEEGVRLELGLRDDQLSQLPHPLQFRA